MFEMVCGYVPFQGDCREEFYNSLSAGVIKIPLRLKISYDCVDFINMCLQEKVHARPTITELVNHPFLIQYAYERTGPVPQFITEEQKETRMLIGLRDVDQSSGSTQNPASQDCTSLFINLKTNDI